jgi:alpha-D-ribose 1-methylphosphonate 5-triphosphate diphosphatase
MSFDPQPTAAGRSTSWRDVRAVTPDGMVDGATVVVEAGVITDVRAGGAAPPDAVDGRGLLLVPGLVDCHSDGLEKEVSPRSSVRFPIDFAMTSFEGRVRAAGITTVFHGVGFQDKAAIGRSVSQAVEMCGVIVDHQRDDARLIDHSILFRFEALDPTAFAALQGQVDAATPHLPAAPPIVSFEDHTPGQGQYRDVDAYAAMIEREQRSDDAAEHVRRVMAEAAEAKPIRDRNLAAVGDLADAGRISLLAHDPDSVEAIEIAAKAGASIAEFPVAIESARHARALGMRIVMGAPNALRGVSHSGNVSARELVHHGLCDALASDYLPSTMLAAAFALAAEGVCSLVEAIGLVTSGPATMTGCDDRGRIEPGARADLVLVDDRHRWPVVIDVTTGRP